MARYVENPQQKDASDDLDVRVYSTVRFTYEKMVFR